MKDDLKEYKQKLEKELSAYMELPVSERSAAAVRGMAECWEQVDKLGKCMCRSADFSKEDAKAWNTDMQNDDGTTGGHWTVQQTTPLAANAGVEGAVILDKVSKSKSVNYGYDAAHDTFGDMIENGIVDPTKVCRSALENAASVSSMVLTTESLVADLPEKAAPAAPAAPDMGGMY